MKKKVDSLAGSSDKHILEVSKLPIKFELVKFHGETQKYLESYKAGYTDGATAAFDLAKKANESTVMMDKETAQQLWILLCQQYISHSRFPKVHTLLRRLSEGR